MKPNEKKAQEEATDKNEQPNTAPAENLIETVTNHFEITSNITDKSNNLLPTVTLQRCDSQSPAEEALNNGLDPIGLELISSTINDDLLHSPKISREMKNLQKSTNDSKILSNYLNNSDSPRNRTRKSIKDPELAVDTPQESQEELMTEAEDETEMQAAETLKDSMEILNDGVESDSTLVLPMEPPQKRRKSVSRSRSRSRSVLRTRKKSVSVAQMMEDELSMTSDKEPVVEDEDGEMSSSEVSFVTNASVEGRPVNPPPKPGWDSFCFKCHTDTAVLSLACSKCKCSYHRHCVRPNPIPKNVDEFVCPECREVEAAEASKVNKYGHDRIDLHTMSEMLTIILEKIRTYPDREHFEKEIVVIPTKETNVQLIVTQMSLKVLESRIKNRHYKVTEAFIHDIKQLEHNWNVVDKSKTKTLKIIVKYVQTEINELEACVFCYEESFVSGDWFVRPCKRPHLLVWAKLKGYPYWPAKVMSVDSRQHADVRFFGAHDRAWVQSIHCMLFSDKDPNKTKNSQGAKSPQNASKSQKGIVDAMKEKDEYIENLRAKFGFKYAQFRQQLDPNNVQSHLHAMLPGLKNAEKELDGNQKEKLTLKIIKGQSSNYQVEHKQGEQRTPLGGHKESRPKLYKVLSKNDDNGELSGKLNPLIIKRKSRAEILPVKRLKASGNNSETSESNASIQSGASRRSNSTKSKKTSKPEKEKDIAVDQEAKKSKTKENGNDSTASEETSKSKMTRKRLKSSLPDGATPILTIAVPRGTDEIQSLRGNSKTPEPAQVVRAKKRALSYHRSRSVEKDSTKETVVHRRLSGTLETPLKQSKIVIPPKRPSTHKKPEPTFDPQLVVKSEPVSDSEEIHEREGLTVEDIPNLTQEKSNKKKIILISTTESSPMTSTALTHGRAKKSFPNIPNQQQIDLLKAQQLSETNNKWMVCIPQTALPPSTPTPSGSPSVSNRSTPISESQGPVTKPATIAESFAHVNSDLPPPAKPNNSWNTANHGNSMTVESPLNSGNSSNSVGNQSNSWNSRPYPARQEQPQTINTYMNGQHRPVNSVSNLPRLNPRPQGVFTNDGSAFHRDLGPISRLFTDNSHRVADYFRNVLIDTVTSFAPENPLAENVALKSEIEKFQRDIVTTKSDCQHRMQELRREHQDEIDTMRKNYEERLIGLQLKHDQEKNMLIKEIRLQCESEKMRAVETTRKETKKTTWCSNCTKEARFYCCWNTSYCGLQCQKTHWSIHQRNCSNKNSTPEQQQQQQQQITLQQHQMIQAQQIHQQSHPVPQLITVQQQQSRPMLLIRSPQQMAQPQNVILPHRSNPATLTPVNNVAPKNIIVSYQQSASRQIHLFQDRDVIPVVQTLHRDESPNINVIMKTAVADALMQQHVEKAAKTATSSE